VVDAFVAQAFGNLVVLGVEQVVGFADQEQHAVVVLGDTDGTTRTKITIPHYSRIQV
jgi:hypothetical protein